MKKEIAMKVYKFILKEINNWSEENINDLSEIDITCDPIYEGLVKMR